MPSDWRQLARQAGLKVEGDEIVVVCGNDRGQRVSVEERSGCLRLSSVAAKPSALQGEPEPHLFAWSRNRASDLVGFKVDGRGRLIGEAWAPMAGLDADEWAIYVRAVARACDRVEYLLTGRDED